MYGIQDLIEEYGYDNEIEFLEEFGMDNIVPGICVECGATFEYEPDQDRGYCEICGKNTVKSALVLIGF